MGALRCCTTFRQPCGIILERGLPLHSQLLNGGLMPQYMVLRPRGACCTTWHPGDMVQVAAFPLMSHNIQLSQGGPGDSLFSYLGDAESIAKLRCPDPVCSSSRYERSVPSGTVYHATTMSIV